MNTQQLALAFLATVSVGGLAWVFLYPILSGERQAEKRKAVVSRTTPAGRGSPVRDQQKARRSQVEDTLKELETRHKPKKFVPIQSRIEQAGFSFSNPIFYIGSAALGVVAMLVVLMTGAGLLPGIAMGFAASFGLPLWILSYLKRRREDKFLDNFPDAVDIIVRGIKAGLPLLESLRIITLEAPEPIKSEFKAIVDTQAVGIPLGDACGKLFERVPVPEANFFGIVISVQQKAGGNLSEALGNLSRVLRERKKMKAKIQAMSMEAKASATIIGALPLCVMALVYMSSPDYISLLWTEPMGRLMLFCSALWMGIGIFVMKRMINFDF
jgi:tight adherence protein B